MQNRRIGKVIEVKGDRLDEYKALHADSHPGVRDLISAAHIRNFSIYLSRFPDGRYYLFQYYEYTGDDHDADMAQLHVEPRIREWLAMCDPMQIPFPGECSWSEMERVYYQD